MHWRITRKNAALDSGNALNFGAQTPFKETDTSDCGKMDTCAAISATRDGSS